MVKNQNSRKYIHIMSNDKFISPYIEFVNKNFNKNQHFFLIIDGVPEKIIPITKSENVLYHKAITSNNKILRRIFKIFDIRAYFLLNKYCKNYENIYFHGLFDQRFISYIFLFRKYLKKSYWCIWGGDLYCYKARKKRLLYNLWYKIEDFVKGNLAGYITHVGGDYKLAQNWYGTKGKYFDCFMYPSNLYKEVKIKPQTKNELCIQVGNSADPSNNHLEILDKLELYKKANIKIYCILSYGDKKWSEKIANYGIKKFGSKFVPIFDFMKLEEYMNFLSEIDIAIFAHNRQQAVGNITSLLGMGKTVYLKESVTTWKMLTNLGIKLKSFDKFLYLEKLDKDVLEKNKEIIKTRFSKERLIKDWGRIFDD